MGPAKLLSILFMELHYNAFLIRCKFISFEHTDVEVGSSDLKKWLNSKAVMVSSLIDLLIGIDTVSRLNCDKLCPTHEPFPFYLFMVRIS